MEQARLDGRVLKWQLLVPGGMAWRRPWPFMIQWGIPDQERLAWEQPGQHLLGVTGVVGVAVVVVDLDTAKDLYGRQLGLTLGRLMTHNKTQQIVAKVRRLARVARALRSEAVSYS